MNEVVKVFAEASILALVEGGRVDAVGHVGEVGTCRGSGCRTWSLRGYQLKSPRQTVSETNQW